MGGGAALRSGRRLFLRRPGAMGQADRRAGRRVTSDGLLGFEMLERLGYTHHVIIAPRGRAGTEIEPFKWPNVLPGNRKTTLSGTHREFLEYARRYLAEVQYRF